MITRTNSHSINTKESYILFDLSLFCSFCLEKVSFKNCQLFDNVLRHDLFSDMIRKKNNEMRKQNTKVGKMQHWSKINIYACSTNFSFILSRNCKSCLIDKESGHKLKDNNENWVE